MSMCNPGQGFPPACLLPDLLIHLGGFGLQVGQQLLQQFRNSPLLLGETSLKHKQPTGRDKAGEDVRMEGMLRYTAAARVSSGYRCRMKSESKEVLPVTQTRRVFGTWRP